MVKTKIMQALKRPITRSDSQDNIEICEFEKSLLRKACSSYKIYSNKNVGRTNNLQNTILDSSLYLLIVKISLAGFSTGQL